MTPREKEAIKTILDTFPGAQVLIPQAIADEVAQWGQAKREAYEERAAIVEEGEKCSRVAAENLAYAMQEKKGKSMAIINERMSAAKAYAARGWPVLPIVPGEKSPLIAGGYKSATINPAKIEEWWQRWPGAGVAIATGLGAGLLVLDVDKKHGGDVSMKEYAQRHGRPYTLMAKTPSGGWHIYFELPQETIIGPSVSEFGKGVDVRCEGSYIIAPPTPGYSWLLSLREKSTPLDYAVAATGAALERLPGHMLSTLRSIDSNDQGQWQKKDWSNITGQQIDDGRRDDTLTSIAGAVVSGCRDEALVIEILSCVNERRCRPPMDARSIEKIARSIINKHNRSNRE